MRNEGTLSAATVTSEAVLVSLMLRIEYTCCQQMWKPLLVCEVHRDDISPFPICVVHWDISVFLSCCGPNHPLNLTLTNTVSLLVPSCLLGIFHSWWLAHVLISHLVRGLAVLRSVQTVPELCSISQVSDTSPRLRTPWHHPVEGVSRADTDASVTWQDYSQCSVRLGMKASGRTGQ